jgi:hypothetical protein
MGHLENKQIQYDLTWYYSVHPVGEGVAGRWRSSAIRTTYETTMPMPIRLCVRVHVPVHHIWSSTLRCFRNCSVRVTMPGFVAYATSRVGYQVAVSVIMFGTMYGIFAAADPNVYLYVSYPCIAVCALIVATRVGMYAVDIPSAPTSEPLSSPRMLFPAAIVYCCVFGLPPAVISLLALAWHMHTLEDTLPGLMRATRKRWWSEYSPCPIAEDGPPAE